MSETIDYAAVAAGLELIKKANRAIDRRKYTDRPGSSWHVMESLPGSDYTGTPAYNGIRAKARLYYTADGSKYEVCVYSYAGQELHKVTRKSLDAALRIGQKLASGGN